MIKLQEKNPSLPFEDWFYYKDNTPPRLGVGCATYPLQNQIHMKNPSWQVQKVKNVTVYIFGAYYDNRTDPKMIRVITMLPFLNFNFSLKCQMWFKIDKKPIIVPVSSFFLMWIRAYGKIKEEYPYLLTCDIPKSHAGLVPDSVSIVGERCDKGTNNVRVIYNKYSDEEKSDFGVCVKGLSFIDEKKSVQLIEWFELLSLSGANKVHLYLFEAHELTKKVLEYYKAQGKITVTPFTVLHNLPPISGLINVNLMKHMTVKRLHEVVSYTDCLYKNMYRHKYIALFDTDEIIVGTRTPHWIDLINDLLPNNEKEGHHHSSYCGRNVYFMDESQNHPEVPEYMYMLQRTKRSKNFTGPGAYVKCFHDTSNVVVLHNHFPFKCLGQCYSQHFNTDEAYMHHYRKSCHPEIRNCSEKFWNHQIEDKSVWQFMPEVINNVKKSMIELGFMKIANEN